MKRRALLGALLAGPARAACPLAPQAVVPLRRIEGFAVVTAAIGAQPASFLLDTGAQAHLVLPEAQQRLRLPALPGTVPLIGTGGTAEAPLVVLAGVRLGPVLLDPAPTPVAPLPVVPPVTPMLAGLLGSPLLRHFDLDLDAPSGRLGLYPPGACGDAEPALGAGQTTLPLSLTADGEVLLVVQIDGVPLNALLDTGSRATLLSVDTARRLGLAVPGSANTARGVDGTQLPVGHLRVGTFAVGADLRRDVPVSVAPLQLGGADLLLGFDYLGTRRVWVSAVTGRVTIALPSPRASSR